MSTALLTPDDVALLIGKTSHWVRKAARRGDLGHVKAGRDLRFTEGHVRDWVAAHTHEPAARPEQSWGRVTRHTRRTT